MNQPAPILVLGLGNDMVGDDAVGLIAARALHEQSLAGVDVVESGEAGLALLEIMVGRKCALVMDAMVSATRPPGTVLSFALSDLRAIRHPAPHYAGLPEVAQLAAELSLDFPTDVRAVAMCIAQPHELREGLSPAVAAALPAMVAVALDVLAEWDSPSPPGGAL